MHFMTQRYGLEYLTTCTLLVRTWTLALLEYTLKFVLLEVGHRNVAPLNLNLLDCTETWTLNT